MKAFVAVLSVLALAAADQSSHQTIKHGNAPAVHSSIHKPHGGSHAHVVSQPSAQPNEVNQAYNEEKYTAAAHAPSHEVRTPAYHPAPHHAPVHHAPAYHAAPVHHAPAYHAAPVHHAPAPYHPSPVHHAAPVHHAPAPYHPAPAHGHAHGDEYEAAPVYQYGYAVADDYSGSNFAQNENRDNYATNGEYRVALPDGRTQIVSYSVADAYSGYVADVRYEGEAKYEPYQPAHKNAYHPAPAPAYNA
ncbi:histidine-rich protein PFHRP-II-like [Tigriopus californicus]|uniref:histidine-rich protein PFHRP-II-like n=1 Tax=Tigriopus californicus TaxID=6832 RepID=UPI0027DAA4E6|nr:histidine-rich protein PFHRP-II-like [Tigriopus californicus]XP_059087070.1 histidine-rich protein PFHRP-II-like [Tigriopus californicus]|eukprot:TCALIF_10125-PB protein Name:"Similar to resilin Pro-resilin (Drosophila melanogaster)" AED:0.31 eAED:0.32 QI:214/1/0.5/1/1/1/2/0/245